MNPEHYPIGLDYGLKPSEKKELTDKQLAMVAKARETWALGRTEKKWKPILPAWQWSGLSLDRFLEYCERKEINKL